MASRRFKNPIYSVLFFISESPQSVLKYIQYALIFWFLLSVMAGAGGFIPLGEGVLGPGLTLFVLAMVHALVTVFRDERPGVRWELLLPLPFIVYLWVQFRFLSPLPWEAAKLLTIVVQAYAFFIILFNTLCGIRSMRWITSLVQAVVWIGLIVALVQFHLFPEWFPGVEGRLRDPALSHGMAGFLQDSQGMAALLLATLPLSLILTVKYLKSGPNAILQAGMSVAAAVGILLSSHRPGLLILLFTLILVPLLANPFRRVRVKVFKIAIPAILLALAGMWFGTGELRDRFMLYLDGPVAPLAPHSQAVAVDAFMEAPLFGHGFGTFDQIWEHNLPAGVTASVEFPYSFYLGLLAESGLAGLLLFLLPVAVCGMAGVLAWRRIPYLKMDPDTAQRLERLPRDHPARLRVEREKGRLPTQKAYLGGILLGLLALSLYMAWDYSYMLPIVLLIAVSLAAILLGLARGFAFRPASPAVALTTGLLPLLLVGWSLPFGMDRIASGKFALVAQEQLDALQAEPDLIFLDPGSLSLVVGTFQNALKLDPLNGEAWSGLAATQLAQLHANLLAAPVVAREAEPAAVQAVELDSGNWVSHYSLARVLLLLGKDPDGALHHLERALELAPRRPEPAGLLGSLLLLDEPASQRGRQLLQQALDINPDYAPVVNARRRQIAHERAESGSSDVLVNRDLLAEQFYLLPSRAPAIHPAGLPDLEDFLPVLPTREEGA